jgi:subtilase family serine protease
MDGRTDMTKPTIASRNFANAPKTRLQVIYFHIFHNLSYYVHLLKQQWNSNYKQTLTEE